jgi:hypothetical protein
MENHKTRDILHVMQILGHKSIRNTMMYTQLVDFQEDDYVARIAHSENKTCQLIEAGFEFVCDFGQTKFSGNASNNRSKRAGGDLILRPAKDFNRKTSIFWINKSGLQRTSALLETEFHQLMNASCPNTHNRVCASPIDLQCTVFFRNGCTAKDHVRNISSTFPRILRL